MATVTYVSIYYFVNDDFEENKVSAYIDMLDITENVFFISDIILS